MTRKAMYEMDAWTFKDNLENIHVNIAESAINPLLFRPKSEYIDNGITEDELANIKITVIVETI